MNARDYSLKQSKKNPTRYKIVRREMLSRRLKWITRLLLSLSPELYQPGDYNYVKNAMDFIRKHIDNLEIMKHHSCLYLKQEKNVLAFVNKQQTCYLSFSIEEV